MITGQPPAMRQHILNGKNHLWHKVYSLRIRRQKSFLVVTNYRIAVNFRGRKLLRISRFYGYSRKFSSWNFEVLSPLGWQNKQSAKIFSVKIVFITHLWNFSPSKVFHYTVLMVSQYATRWCQSRAWLLTNYWLSTEFYSMEVFFKLWIPSWVYFLLPLQPTMNLLRCPLQLRLISQGFI